MDHKQIATTFLRWAASGRVKEAYDTFVGPSFKHHNPYFADDVNALCEAMQDDADRHPNKDLQIVHVIEDGDFVAVHSHLTQPAPQPRDIAVVHILRFEDDRIAEFWDVAQSVPAQSPNANGMF